MRAKDAKDVGACHDPGSPAGRSRTNKGDVTQARSTSASHLDNDSSSAQCLPAANLHAVMAPTIFIVPGLYEGPASFAPLVDALRGVDLTKVHVTTLPSTGATSGPGGTISMDDDAAAIAADMATIVEEAGTEGVVAVLHSAGGFLGSGAMRGLAASTREAAGKTGGVRAIVFLAAGLAPEGFEHKPLPFMEFDVGFPLCWPFSTTTTQHHGVAVGGGGDRMGRE